MEIRSHLHDSPLCKTVSQVHHTGFMEILILIFRGKQVPSCTNCRVISDGEISLAVSHMFNCFVILICVDPVGRLSKLAVTLHAVCNSFTIDNGDPSSMKSYFRFQLLWSGARVYILA